MGKLYMVWMQNIIHAYFVLFKHEILLKGNHIKRAKNMLMMWEGFGTTLF